MEMREFRGAVSGSLIVVPAMGEYPQGEQVSFLFALSQVEDILGSLACCRVPFAPPYICGVADWRGQALPVLSLETLLGLSEGDPGVTRALVVRKAGPSDEPEHWKRALVRIGAGCRLLAAVPATEPLHAADYLAAAVRPAVKGIYRWSEGLLIVPHLERIVRGELNRVFSDDA